ncbi:small acid-soluble spore protein SspI [Mechercharimyces sp. CAU 1602]|uniref:small acid-soluble spore protein SspI n=1 Tax=Mechercharimyces sp. CAU 1602 TaxID=2973933 RepID=UPI0021623383|nr:small acid-soluble spore protein SspI [Mechercharimyces sp. CAU 1602]MCS1351557.1 small acid-soluble spore protein SspI [Mechercharimyces sp. CAU 1602]
MNFDVRGAVIYNIHEMDKEELSGMIQDSIKEGDEKLLPGLGVVFELVWKNSDEEEKQQLVNVLHQAMPENAKAPL